MDNITVKEDRGKVTVTISGAAYRNLQHMAEALNKGAPWGSDEDTAQTVLDTFFLGKAGDGCFRDIETADGARELWESMVVDGLDYLPEYRGRGKGKEAEELEAKREAELRAYPVAFEDAQ